jgi:hypothetical protein
MTKDKAVHSFNIIKVRTPTKVTLANGMTFHKQEDQKFWIPELGGFIHAAPYDNHFIFEIPDTPKTKGIPSYMCSCGSFAVIPGSNAYAHLGSPEGMMLVCHYHTTYNLHADGSQ